MRRVLLPLGAGLIIVSSLMKTPAQAGHSTFVVDGVDGYGIGDCLTNGGDCGRMVADAWCQEHNKGAAVAFGLAADITGSIGAAAPKPAPGDILVTCGD